MREQSPFPFPGSSGAAAAFDRFAQSLGEHLKPPPWLIEEMQRRVVLLLNHVLRQEPAAMERLLRRKGSVLLMQWRSISIPFVVTPAGLLDLASDSATPDLRITVATESPLRLAQATLAGDKPEVQIEGDVQLAAEVNWLVDHVRWDIEEDLARVLGDGPAHLLGEGARRAAAALHRFTAPLRARARQQDPEGGVDA